MRGTESLRTPRPLTTRALLVDRNFGPWFWGALVSNSGTWLYNVVAAVVMFELTGSALFVGFVSVAQFAALVVMSPWAGALSDRHDRRRVALLGQSFAFVASVAVTIPAIALGVESLGPWMILAATLAIGLGRGFAEPAMASLIPALVDERDLESAVSLNSLTYSGGRALGPIGAGVLLVALGPGVAFAVNAVTFLAHIAALATVRLKPQEAPSGDRSVRAALRHVRDDRPLFVLLGGIATVGFASDPVITLAPSLARLLGGGDGLVAAFVSTFGMSAVVGGLVSGGVQRRLGSLRVAKTGMVTMAAGLLVAASAPLAWAALAGFAITGLGFVLGLTSFTSLLQRRVPEALRGRIMALWMVAFLGNRPVAALLHGGAADVIGPRLAVGLAIAAALIGARLARRPDED
ncbi:MAG TPA: MFS transporter [Actinomycetota bacterium]|nr:MFS transporter [Actinomycetota bacterium]